MENIKAKITVDAFRVTQSMLPPIPTLIVKTNEGSPTRKPGDLPEEPLITPPSEFFIIESGQQIISFISSTSKNPQEKGKQIATDSNSPVKMFKKSEGWSQEQIDQALEESI
ncbi:unnamed protein product [Lactuca virosa]|uniref:Uncharacterized protein n=1 Tax=Lactuca virosa TaxID=75947 RepID=A0AAU9NJ85_9ASTR|nr:unnamed protein product [Lactuca virosa]